LLIQFTPLTRYEIPKGGRVSDLRQHGLAENPQRLSLRDLLRQLLVKIVQLLKLIHALRLG